MELKLEFMDGLGGPGGMGLKVTESLFGDKRGGITFVEDKSCIS